MLAKNQKSTVSQSTETSPVPFFKKPLVKKAIGLALLLGSASVLAQGLPLMYVFIGAYLGVPADATIGDMDSMIWLLTSSVMSVIVLYVFLKWTKFVLNRFMKKAPASLKVLDGKGKRAQV